MRIGIFDTEGFKYGGGRFQARQFTSVFGLMRARREGEGGKGGRLARGSSYAKRLRHHLKLAGVTRHELHNDVAADAASLYGHEYDPRRCQALATGGLAP